jgi:hypothetical protein
MVIKLIRKRGDLVKKILSTLILLALLVLPVAAWALPVPTLSFSIPANGGLVQFTGAPGYYDFQAGAWVPGAVGTITGGTNPGDLSAIVVTSVTGEDTLYNSGVTLPITGYLVFQTGTAFGAGVLLFPGVWTETYQTANTYGSSLSIDSGILSGNFIEGTMNSASLNTNSGTFSASFNSFGLDAFLASYYGVTGLGTGVVSLGTGGTGLGSTSGSVTLTSFMPANGQITLYTSNVPIPPTVLLLGAGLMGIGVVRKRII